VKSIVSPSRPHHRATKIVATIGPATADAAAMAKLVDAGVDVARFNVKHNTHVRGRAGRPPTYVSLSILAGSLTPR
jgi:hypothetical protein